MTLKTTLLATLALTTLFTAPAMAANPQKQPEIAPEALSTAEQPPSNYDAAAKSARSSLEIKNGNPVAVLDPGHGGSDPGAVGYSLQEKDITLDIALRTRAYIWANYPMWVYMTRETDVYKSLNERTSFANAQYADLFVSMHINSYSTSAASGLETYGYPGAADSISLATRIYDKLKPSFSVHRGVKTAEFYVLKYTNMTSMLGETGFISNGTDAGNLAKDTFRQQLAVQYAQGMHTYWWGY
ncbi:N-acetylmuramoyl-L-alanine amidase [Tumebacillus sp. DT12]|uniref:N-acetylmuramoyl-L-alanine amidase n=1 Tax=Tumebacillus lacus TaxID=2995335 RepID=A0ABT3X8K5_9BACL|nr:N-acetylmuramoyl-L-alanine amidase [Tumebacillus lacus]MCX7571099.1 N-acetylmuramoyl-L-alanine amidase [Tumebacillus lacus]